MEMKSMLLTKKESKDMKEGVVPENEPSYSYGLKLNLDDESMKKLGIEKMPKLGKTMILHAKVKVADMNESISANSNYRSLGLQITDMDLEDEKEPLEKRLYPEKK